MVRLIAEAWARIEDWLASHAPVSAAVLAPPAAPEVITAAEAALGLEFPRQLVESLRRHDGLTEWANVLPESRPLAVAEILEHHRIRMEIAPSVDGFSTGPDTEA
ncbi:hypothetical protein [Cryptosporangium minutisporangium]|uniref:Knr4/Smi1-like domain-containing protein n=1 Tax=Cryptosporangium minutisporangium TaxID=113569 RepID=A0ABP6SYZ1_9ACTN